MGYEAAVASGNAMLDTDTIQLILADQDRLATLRSPYEPVFREIDRYVDPFGAGGFDKRSSPDLRGMDDLFDITAPDGLDRYTAAIGGLTIPRQQRWHGVEFDDKDLMKLPAVKRWSQHATDRLFTARYAPTAGFEVQAFEDIRQEGKYGTSALWVGERLGVGLFYKSLHLSEIFVDEDYCGRVDRVHRLYCTTILKAWREAEKYGARLSDKSMALLEDPTKRHSEIEILHVVRPNAEYEPGYLGARGKPVESVYVEVGEKWPIRRSGFRKMPILVSRHVTGPRDVYGRSPAMKALATIKGLNSMARIILNAGNKAADPPLLFFDDGDITKVVTKAGGLTPGGMSENGKPLVAPLHTGAELPIGMEMQDQERNIVKRVFLEELFLLLSNPSDRMTATQVIEQLKKEGVLVAPFAGRRETEKLGPQVERELEIMMNAGAIDELPPEVKEAGLVPKIRMTNPLSRMARAEEVSGFTRGAEIAVQAASAGATEALEIVNWDEGLRDTFEVLGARPSHVFSPDEVAARRKARKEEEAAAAGVEAAPKVAAAALDLARANDLSNGGGLG